MNKKFFNSLSLRVLVLTMAFVIISEAIILIPSIARSYEVILQQRIDGAYLASMLLPQQRSSNKFSHPELLDSLNAYAILYKRMGDSITIGNFDSAPRPDVTVNLTTANLVQLSNWALGSFNHEESRVIIVSGFATKDPSVMIQMILDESPIRQSLAEFTSRNIQLSVSVALITALLVFAALQFYMVSPLQRISNAMIAFRRDPENPSKSILPSNRKDEIGTAERELSHMQNGLRMALRQKARLAALGAAVTKINHDLRNILATAQLVSDRLASIEDPNVQKLTPRLLSSIDRATALCESTLSYAKEGIAQIQRSKFYLSALVREVGQSLMLQDDQQVIDIQMDEHLQIEADRNEMFRVLTNLLRNAMESGANHITVTADHKSQLTQIRIADDGPGLKPTARERLFQPFAGSARKGGTGLGLTIARDLMRAHDGDIALLETGDKGTVFELTLPDHISVTVTGDQ